MAHLAFNPARFLVMLILALAFPALFPAQVQAQAQGQASLETVESRAFKHAATAFQDGLYERAERDFRQFVTTFPQSPMLAEAILLQAQASLRLTNAPAAITVLSANQSKAGLILDQYRYWLGKAYLDSSNYVAAANTFGSIATGLTNSTLLLEASHGQALARFRLGEFGTVIALLQDPQGAFQRASRVRPNDELTTRGTMLLAESLVRQQQYEPAARILEGIQDDKLTPDFRWDRSYLLCRLLMAEGRLQEAIVQSTNLIQAAGATGRPTAVADSLMVQAGILEQLNRLDEAIEIYTRNLADSVPNDRKRLALLNIIELKLAQEKILEAGSMLETFLSRHPEDAATDVVLLTLGELQLKLHLTSRAGSTNLATQLTETNRLRAALGHFETVLATNNAGAKASAHTNDLRGKALLNKGWCLWLETNIAASAAAFRAALETLPVSEEQAVARFKLADTFFEQNDFTNALVHYRAVTNDYAQLPRVRSALFDQALYQMVHVAVAMNDEAGATSVMRSLLNWYPESLLADRSLFLVGQELLRLRRPRDARERLEEFTRQFPSSPLRPEVELAIARTYFQEGAWPQAISSYEQWLGAHSTNQLRARAAFNRAWALYRAGQETNALQQFTNFLAEFPLDRELAPRAQYWVAEHYYRQGQHREAIENFQRIPENTNWPTTLLTYQARLNAGKAAAAAQLWNDAGGAKGHFPLLIGDDGCPEEIRTEALFAYGDTLISWDLSPTEPIKKFREAKDVFSRITLRHTNSPLVAAAWGKIGECYLQMASQDPKQYGEATNAFLQVIQDRTASVRLRSQAEFGLARALELQSLQAATTPAEAAALQKAAFDHFYNVVNGENLLESEQLDPFWLEKAGVEAARIAEAQKQWNVAIAIYRRLQRTLEPIRPRLDERIKRIQEASQREQD